MKRVLLFVNITFFFFISFNLIAQPIQELQESSYNNFSIGSYERIGANWSFDVQGALARTLNLNGIGMLGRRKKYWSLFWS